MTAVVLYLRLGRDQKCRQVFAMQFAMGSVERIVLYKNPSLPGFILFASVSEVIEVLEERLLSPYQDNEYVTQCT